MANNANFAQLGRLPSADGLYEMRKRENLYEWVIAGDNPPAPPAPPGTDVVIDTKLFDTEAVIPNERRIDADGREYVALNTVLLEMASDQRTADEIDSAFLVQNAPLSPTMASPLDLQNFPNGIILSEAPVS